MLRSSTCGFHDFGTMNLFDSQVHKLMSHKGYAWLASIVGEGRVWSNKRLKLQVILAAIKQSWGQMWVTAWLQMECIYVYSYIYTILNRANVFKHWRSYMVYLFFCMFAWWSTYTHSQQITRNTFKNRHDIHIPSMVFAFSPQTRWARMCQMTWESIIVHPSLIVDKFAASKLDHYERCVRRTIWNEMGPYIYILYYIYTDSGKTLTEAF